MKKHLFFLLTFALILFTGTSFGQATKSYPFAVGILEECSGSSSYIHFYDYDGATNRINSITGNKNSVNMVGRFKPQLRIGSSNSYGQRFSHSMASVSFNPKDHHFYYHWISSGNSAVPGQPAMWSYIWRWDFTETGNQGKSGSDRLDTLCSMQGVILGIVFDDEGNSFVIEYEGARTVGKTTIPGTAFIRSLDLDTRVFGPRSKLNLTGGVILTTKDNLGVSGDVAMTPSGQMFFIMENMLFSPDYKSYDGTGNDLTCTYIGPVSGSSGNFVGLTYADGKMISAYSGNGCLLNEINMLTAATSNITKVGTVSKANDMATIVSGIGAAKNLVSVTPTATANQYDVVYDVYVRNYGNMDISDVQVTDDLTKINGAGNVSNVSISFVANPAGLVLNTGYNGKGDINLLYGTGILPNYPIANNHAIIRISCRLSNIMPGVVYNNIAIATARDFNKNTLRDTSTNGTNPDLNSNDKPDDLSESQPTPLLIAVTSSTDPCATLGQIILKQTFGRTSNGNPTHLAKADFGNVSPTTQYTGSINFPLQIEQFTLNENARNGDIGRWINLTDHTGNSGGRMMIINADAMPYVIYRDEVASLCANQQYSFFFYGAFIGNSSYQTVCNAFGGFKYPKVTLRVRDKVSGAVIAQSTTASMTSTSWQQYGMKFTLPPGFSNVILELVNAGEGGCGNDLAIDDIQFGLCSPAPVVSILSKTAGCTEYSVTFDATLSDPTAITGAIDYQWQVYNAINDTYNNISGATGATYTIPVVGPAQENKFYRVIVAGAGNMGSPTCMYTSPPFQLTPKTQSTIATRAVTSHLKVCPGKKVTLTVQGGTLGDGASWHWYAGSCGGTPVGIGSSVDVTVNATTTYYVRAEGDCNMTGCRQVTVTINCDIDKDKDGIPDWVESNIPESFGDHDGDGIINAYDEDYIFVDKNGVSHPYVDNNGDFINDWFQADGDVDGDGIPNYLDLDFPGRVDVNGDGVDDRFDADLDGIINMLDLDSDNDGIPDVVEAGGVDVNGDGKLDNFVDADGDGLSDQVDRNLFGAYNSGVGLGLKDTDGDGVPNQFDLDSDNDGIPDVREVGGADANNDGRIDGFIDLNNDGISDHIVGANALLRTGPDINNDGRADSYPYHNMDRDGVPNPYDLDSDGDGIVDVIEAGFIDANYDGRIDGPIGPNGWSTIVSSMPTLTLRNSDSDPYPDYLDIDSDNDGIPDLIEGPATAQFRFPLGVDSDGDGIDDAFDTWKNVWGGFGNYPIDTDGDGTPDYLDLDSDGDGVPDIKEGHDYNFDGAFNENTVLMGTDADGDGLDDRFDLDNTSAKGTSSNLGNGGTTAGDVSPGTRAVVQKTIPTAYDRDWRYRHYALPVNLLKVTGSYLGNSALLNWEIESAEEIVGFEILRSTDNLKFETIQKLDWKVASHQRRSFNYNDDILSLSTENVFYKIQVKGVSGRLMMSNVIRVHAAPAFRQLMIKPNPASHYASVHFNSETGGKAFVKIIDNTGKVSLTMTRQLIKGNNVIEITDLSRLSNGVYTVQIMSDGEVVNMKLVISR